MSSLAHGRSIIVKLDHDRGHRLRRARPLTASQRTRRAWWRLALLLAAVMMLAAMHTGCASMAGAAGDVTEYNYESPTAHSPAPGHARTENSSLAAHDRSEKSVQRPEASKPDVAPETQRLAEQSQRDVEMLLKARQSGKSGGGATGAVDGTDEPSTAPSAAPSADGSAATPPRRMVV